ncbi:hypothetical protein ACFX11_028090 [Malus domestica]
MKPYGGYETLTLPSCVRGKTAFVLSNLTSSLCSCVSALLVSVLNGDCPSFLLNIGMYRKTGVFGPFEGVTFPLVVVGLPGSSSFLLEDGTTSPFLLFGHDLPLLFLGCGFAWKSFGYNVLASVKCDSVSVNGLVSPCVTFTHSW